MQKKLLTGSRSSVFLAKTAIGVIEKYRKPMRKYLSSKRFTPPSDIYEMAEAANKILSVGNCTGEGWFLTAEMIELIEAGVPNIVCMQPCMPAQSCNRKRHDKGFERNILRATLWQWITILVPVRLTS